MNGGHGEKKGKVLVFLFNFKESFTYLTHWKEKVKYLAFLILLVWWELYTCKRLFFVLIIEWSENDRTHLCWKLFSPMKTLCFKKNLYSLSGQLSQHFLHLLIVLPLSKQINSFSEWGHFSKLTQEIGVTLTLRERLEFYSVVLSIPMKSKRRSR